MKISDILKTLAAVAKTVPAASKLVSPQALEGGAALYESYEKAQTSGFSTSDKIALGIQGLEFLTAQGLTLSDVTQIASAAAPVLSASIK